MARSRNFSIVREPSQFCLRFTGRRTRINQDTETTLHEREHEMTEGHLLARNRPFVKTYRRLEWHGLLSCRERKTASRLSAPHPFDGHSNNGSVAASWFLIVLRLFGVIVR